MRQFCLFWFVYQTFNPNTLFRIKLSYRVKMMARVSMASFKRRSALWLSQGISPRRLALTLALGLAIGCIPVFGISTLVCVGLAFALRLNLPAIQAANYAVMPLQFLMIVPFVRLGGRLFTSRQLQPVSISALSHASPFVVIQQFGSLAGQALAAWLILAIPAVILLTAAFTPLLRRVPALAPAESAD